MQIVHLDECHSTQEYLKNQLSEGSLSAPALVFTHNQTSGRGRRNKVWHHFKGSLAFSFVTEKFQPITFSPLAIGVLICEALKELNKEIYLKWPNDLVTKEGKKIGGILSQVYKENLIIAGVGINYFLNEDKDFEYPHASLLNAEESFDTPSFLEKLGEKLKGRKRDFSVAWNGFCFHLNKEVNIVDQTSVNGVFKGIGESGEALLELPSGVIQSVFTGSLRFP